MRKDFEITSNGELTPGFIERQGDIWVCESGSASCIAVDPRTALVGALGLVNGQEVWDLQRNQLKGGE